MRNSPTLAGSDWTRARVSSHKFPFLLNLPHPPRQNTVQAKLADFGGLGMDTGPAVVSAKVLAHDFLTGEAPGKPSDVYGAYILLLSKL